MSAYELFFCSVFVREIARGDIGIGIEKALSE